MFNSFQFGSGATSLTKFAVNNVEAAVGLDFKNQQYRLADQPVTFADAFIGSSPDLTYGTTSNSTMVQGYGPELVTNGGFDADVSGWTADATSAIAYDNGTLQHTTTAAGPTFADVKQDITTVSGGAYQVTGSLTSRSATKNILVQAGGVTKQTISSDTGNIDFVFVASGTTTEIKLGMQGATSSDTFNIDNISVRELPKIVWAPHNLVTYSEDFSQSWLLRSSTLTSVSAVEAPDGSSSVFEVSHTANGSHIRLDTSARADVRYTYGIFMKYVDHQWVAIASNNSSPPYYTWFDIQNGVKGSSAAADTSITSVGNGWYLIQAPQIANDTTSYFEVHLATGDNVTAESVGTSAYIWGAHVYRSDLGGMGQVPGAATGFEYYVPTSGSAKYLPRVGHHVYDTTTSSWVNEGLLLESEARTNLRTYSTVPDSTNAYRVNATSTSSTETAPDGSTDAVLLTATGSGADNAWDNYNNTYGSYDETVMTYSFWIKAEDATSVTLGLFGKSVTYTFATDSITTPADATGHVEHYGNGWVRLGCTATKTNEFHYWQVKLDGVDDTTKTAHVWGVQLEVGDTPSSYIPTLGSTVTRAAQTLDVPPAQFSWPTVEYTGSELVVDNDGNYVGDFNSIADINSWSNDGTSVISILPEDQLFIDRNGSTTQAGHRVATIALSGLTIGKTYRVGVNVVELSNHFNIVVFDNSYSILRESTDSSSTGIQTLIFKATVTDPIIGLSLNTLNATAKVTDVSVREINPLSVSIQMDGRMTYADENSSAQAYPWRWFLSSADRMQCRFFTNNGSGGINLYQSATSGGTASVSTSGDLYTPGINVPFNIASRHGFTFVNGAVDGVALTANTTPTALPDLSSTNLQIARDFMGTIGQFRQWDEDIGETGIEEASS